MKSRTTIIMLAVCLGLFGYLKFYHSKRLTTTEALERQGKPVKLDRDKVNAITLRNAEGTFEFVKRDGIWFLDAPVKDRAESATVSALFTSAEGINWNPVQGVKDEKEAMKEFGLSKGDVSIKFSGEKGLDGYDGKTTSVEILIGKDSAIEGRVYFRINGAKTAYIGSKDLRDDAAKGIKDWRSRALSEITASQVNKLLLKTAKGEIELEKTAANWSFTKPFKARGDNQKVTDMISNALTARIEEFLTDSKDLGAFGLSEPRATLTLYAEGEKHPVVLQIGGPKAVKKEEPKKDGKPDAQKDDPEKEKPAPATHVYVKLSTREGVVTVPIAIEALIAKQPNDLRDQSLMRVQSDIVDRIAIETPGKGRIVLGRSGEEWVRKVEGGKDEPINGGGANKLLNSLVNAKVTRLVADMASDLKGFGLDKPTTVTLSSYSTEGTPETKPGEKPIVKLLLGRLEGDGGYAKLDDEPFIVAVDKLLMEEIWTDPLQWQELKVLDLKKADIVSIEITRTGQQPATYERNRDKGWKLAKGDGNVNQNAADSLVNALASLRAVRWVGATDKAAHGLAMPNLVISFGMADKKTGKLTIGSNTKDEMWHAVLDDRAGTFLINALDFDALNAALVESPKAAAGDPPKPAAPGANPPIIGATPPVSVPPAVDPTAAPPKPAVSTTPPPPAPAPEPAKTPAPAKPTEVPPGPPSPAPDPTSKPE